MIHILEKRSLPHNSQVYTNFACFNYNNLRGKNKSTVKAEKNQNLASRTPTIKSVNQCFPF